MKKLAHHITSVVNISYHIIWCPKCRRKVLVGDVEQRLKEILPEIAHDMDCSIETMEVMPDHIHVFLRGTPTLPVHLIVKNLKAISARMLRSEFPHLKQKMNSMWTRSYYCETIGSISEQTIQEYIENQKNA
ncbi:MAG: IS200/IS605 family transposase [Bacteroidales bacterium]|nr:IS200/IS605 family transposase [Bacteroidales bacterium]